MKKRYLRRVMFGMTLVMTGFFGFPGLAMAQQASISSTGPDSYNKIEFEDSDICKVENNNNVGVTNVNHQNAQTGDASVGGSEWHKYDPAAWKARGASYDDWHAAASAYMNGYKWNGHGGGNTTGGDATSGDATNGNNTKTNVAIDNSGACAEYVLVDTDGDGKPDKKVTKKPGHVLGSTSSKAAMAGANGGAGGHVLGATNGAGGYGGVGGQGSTGGAYNPTTSGGAGGGHGDNGQNGGSGGGGDNYTIDTTGPDSYNKIDVQEKSYTSVTNNNNVYVKNFNKQTAKSGDASVTGNTTGGAAESGGAHNGNQTGTGAGINN